VPGVKRLDLSKGVILKIGINRHGLFFPFTGVSWLHAGTGAVVAEEQVAQHDSIRMRRIACGKDQGQGALLCQVTQLGQGSLSTLGSQLCFVAAAKLREFLRVMPKLGT
jgi:hypothetical protein